MIITMTGHFAADALLPSMPIMHLKLEWKKGKKMVLRSNKMFSGETRETDVSHASSNIVCIPLIGVHFHSTLNVNNKTGGEHRPRKCKCGKVK